DGEVGIADRLVGQVSERDRLARLADGERPGQVGGRRVVAVAGLGRRDRARAGGGDVDGRAANRAVAGRGGGDGPAGRRRGDHAEGGIAERLAGQGAERDRLARLADRERLRHVRRGLVVAVAGLRRRDRAGAGAGDVDGRAADRAVAGRGEDDGQAGRRRGAHPEIRIAEGLVGQRAERGRLARLAGGER